ncbi:MAG: hypothetical protein C0397_02290 [Odoribacter sp.]|nr:hypothetical protein [Odoribacter sp.]
MMPESLLICNEQEKRRIIISDILYISTNDYLSTFNLKNNKKFTCSKPLSEISEILPDWFFQISRSCTINLNEIISVKRCSRKIILGNSTELIVSMRRMKALNNTLASQNVALAR